jgi:hypothetical protein
MPAGGVRVGLPAFMAPSVAAAARREVRGDGRAAAGCSRGPVPGSRPGSRGPVCRAPGVRCARVPGVRCARVPGGRGARVPGTAPGVRCAGFPARRPYHPYRRRRQHRWLVVAVRRSGPGRIDGSALLLGHRRCAIAAVTGPGPDRNSGPAMRVTTTLRPVRPRPTRARAMPGAPDGAPAGAAAGSRLRELSAAETGRSGAWRD